MAGVDDKVVSLSFDNDDFEAGVAETLESLDRLRSSLSFEGAAEGLNNLTEMTNSVDLGPIEQALDNISEKFSVMGAVGFAAIQKLTHAAIEFASKITDKALGPLLGGGKLRAENLEQARFMFRGLGMDVEAAMDSALQAVQGTAYGLDAAAKVAAQLGGSGMQAGAEMTGALRGIAGVAAMTSTSYEEMGDVFTSAAGKGKISGYELQRIGQRGLNVAAKLAEMWGTTEVEVRRMASEGEISFQTFAAAMDEAFGEHATKANETYTGSLANMRTALSRVGASFFGPHLLQQRDLFNALTPVIDKVHTALKPLITALLGMKAVGIESLIQRLGSIDLTNFTYGIQLISTGLQHAFMAFQQLMAPLKEAFREIFPPSTTSIIITITSAFERFTEKLKMGEETIGRVKSVFRGVFAALAIGMEVVRVVAGLFRDLFETFVAPKLSGGGGGILSFFANIGESLVKLKETLVDGGGIQKAVANIVLFFMGLGERLAPAIESLQRFKDKLVAVFGGGGSGVSGGAEAAAGAFDRVKESVGRLEGIVDRFKERWSGLGDTLSAIVGVLDGVWDILSKWFSELGSKLAEVMGASDFNAAVDIVNVGLLGGIAVMVKKFMDGGLSSLISGGTGIIETIKETFGALTETLAAMQAQLRSKALLNIALAVGVLVAAIVILSMIDSAALFKALTAIGVSFGMLVGVMVLIEKYASTMNPATMTGIATGMILVSAAVLILSFAVKNLADLSWEELARGLLGVAVAMGILVVAIKFINPTQLLSASVGMIAMGIALNIMALAVKSFAEMSWEEMAQGLLGVGVALGMMVLAIKFINPTQMISASVGMIAMGIALNILALAVKSFAEMSWEEMAQGLIGIGVALGLMVLAVNLMNPTQMISASVGMLAMGVALNIIAVAVKSFGGMPWEEMKQGLIGIAVVLGLLVISLNAMMFALPGAAAMIVASAALWILAGVLKELGGMSIGELALALAGLAGVFLVIGVAGALIAPVVPALLALGAAMLLMGAAATLFGIGATLVAKAFEAIAKAGKTGIAVLIESLELFASALPRFVQAFVMAIVAFVQEIVEAAPTLVKAISVLLGHIIQTVIDNVPLIIEALTAIVTGFITFLTEAVPAFIEMGFTILMALLQGLRDNIAQITILAAEIIVGFVTALTASAYMLVDAAVALILAFIGALTERAVELVTAGLTLVTRLIEGITANVAMVTTAVAALIIEFLAEITRSLMRIVEAGTQMLIQLLLGISNNVAKVTAAVAFVITRFIEDLGAKAGDIIDAGFKVLTDLLQGIGDNIKDVATTVGTIVSEFITEVGAQAEAISGAGADALVDFLDGLGEDIAAVLDKGVEVAEEFMLGLASRAAKLAGAGMNALVAFLEGLERAIRQNSGRIRSAAVGIADAIIDGVVGGLNDRAQSAIGAAIRRLGGGMVGSFMSAIGANSPSKVFMKMAGYVVSGIVVGLDSDRSAETSSAALADRMTSGFQKTIAKLPEALAGMDDFNPTITPVLDLTKVKMGAKGLESMMGVSTIAPTVSFDKAQQISTTAETTGKDIVTPEYSGPTEVKFEQNIYAPSALSTNDIYRNTKSQIALAKEELNIA